MLDEQACEVEVTTFGRSMQRSPPVLVLGCRVCAMLHKQLREIDIAPFGRPMQWSTPVLVLGYCVRPVLDEERCEN
jgi:hypothetical protein